MEIKSRVLDKWIEELIIEETAYYIKAYHKLEELKTIERNVHKLFRELEDKGFRNLWKNARDEKLPHEKQQELKTKMYEEMWQELYNQGIRYNKEKFLKNGANFANFEIDYEGKPLVNGGRISTFGGRDVMAYSLADVYFLKNYSQSLYDLLSRYDMDENKIAKFSEKNVKAYVQSLLNRIEKRFGKALSVTDSYLSNMESVKFNCENGSCYLEMITAGGYNIQRLHNRILVKPIKN